MEKLILLLGMLFGFEFAFSQEPNYKKRNHKLNKHVTEKFEDNSYVFNIVNENKKINYLEINRKMHKIKGENNLVYAKPKTTFSYKELNRKLRRKYNTNEK